MISVRWRKVLRDLWINDVRTLLAIVAIALGIFGSGFVLTSYAILTREINVNYADTNPASVILYMEEADSEIALAVADLPEVASAELRRVIRGRVLVDTNEWETLKLQVIDDFNDLQITTFTSESGEWPPATGNILMERASVSVMNGLLVDNIIIQTNSGITGELTLSGIVHDPGEAPGWQDNVNFGYITMATLEAMGEERIFNELRFLVAENATDKAYITDVAYQVRDFVEANGYTINRVSVPTPGEHPHTDQMASVLFMLGAFGVLTLILSGILVANIVSALLAQQVRQIGAMKAIGARTYQIAGLYFSSILIYGIGALLFGLPIARAAGRAFAGFTAQLLNFNITSNYVPSWVFAVLILVGLTIPVLSAAIPILRGSRITVREAISDYGIGGTEYGTSTIDMLLSRVRGLNRPLLLSLRNTFRRRIRLLLIIGILTAGGSTFMATFNISRSWPNTLNSTVESLRYDVLVNFSQLYPIDDVEATIEAMPNVRAVESWGQLSVTQMLSDDRDGKLFRLTALPPNTEMVVFPLVEGDWLQSDNPNGIVLSHILVKNYLDEGITINIGDTIPIRIGEQIVEWEVSGVVREIGVPAAYINVETFAEITGTQDLTNTIRIQTTEHDSEFLQNMTQDLESQFDDVGYLRTTVRSSTEWLQILLDHIVVLLALLGIMSALVASVGALALASVISINVMERSREIGIMRSIGASTSAILQVIIVEGIAIGLLSWVVAVAVARPVTIVIGNFAGQIFLQSDLELLFPPEAMVIWLVLVVVISIAASFLPAWNAAHLTVREVVSYE